MTHKLHVAHERQAMNVPTITMPKAEALQAYREYRTAVRANPNRQDRAIMLGYKALSKGNAIIDLVQVMQAAGVHEGTKLPKLAVARADWEHVRFSSSSWRNLWAFESWPGKTNGPRILVPSRTLPEAGFGGHRAIVPIIPPKLRPVGDLSGYCILWEADWKRAPGDPFLLKHLVGTMYAVLAVWDLTPLEQAVLGHRLAALPSV
jgi:hypothetical protein